MFFWRRHLNLFNLLAAPNIVCTLSVKSKTDFHTITGSSMKRFRMDVWKYM